MYPENCICYTGTHDNDTTVGWYMTASEASRDKVRVILNCDGGMVARDFIRTAMGSVARYAIFPLQDALGLDSDSRMNTPEQLWVTGHGVIPKKCSLPALQRTSMSSRYFTEEGGAHDTSDSCCPVFNYLLPFEHTRLPDRADHRSYFKGCKGPKLPVACVQA